MLTSVPSHRHHLPLIDETALSDQHPLAGDGNVIATAFFTDELAAAVAALGHSLARVNTTARRVAIYIPEQVSPRGLCIASASGFRPHAVQPLSSPAHGTASPRPGRDPAPAWTLTRLWELDARAVVYLGADTLALRNFDELFALPFRLGAVPAVRARAHTHDPWGVAFATGVLVLRPSAALSRTMRAAAWGGHGAVEAFLNAFFAADVARLPYAYNAQLAIKERSAAVWAGLRREMRVLQYSTVRPWARGAGGDEGGMPLDELEANARGRGREQGGFYAEDIEIWARMWNETFATYGETLRGCEKLSDRPGDH
ncbi:hypothetical protein BD413DRAFT_618631 [Trametes elegans]|nr:hypothetical protein BD413DRAFT_618631 [Trametes elegans]